MTDPDHDPLVPEFLSGERDRVLDALWKVVATRDPEVLAPAATALPDIARATSAANLGGMLASNGGNLAHAFARLELFRRGACLCAAYLSRLPFYDPEMEQARGHVTIVGTVPNDRQWEPDRLCVCRDCGRRFQVEQGESHHTWWTWTELAVDGVAPRA